MSAGTMVCSRLASRVPALGTRLEAWNTEGPCAPRVDVGWRLAGSTRLWLSEACAQTWSPG
eukprot:1526979-Amphidinium_carterae.1